MLKAKPKPEDFYDTYAGQSAKELFREAERDYYRDALAVAVEAMNAAILDHVDGPYILEQALSTIKGSQS